MLSNQNKKLASIDTNQVNFAYLNAQILPKTIENEQSLMWRTSHFFVYDKRKVRKNLIQIQCVYAII